MINLQPLTIGPDFNDLVDALVLWEIQTVLLLNVRTYKPDDTTMSIVQKDRKTA